MSCVTSMELFVKKSLFLGSSLFLTFSNHSYANDIGNFLNSKLNSSFHSEKINIDSGCQMRNPFSGKCILFWTQYNEYNISRGHAVNSYLSQEQTAGSIIIPITCHIIRHKLDGATNPDSKNGIKTGEENYSASYNINFDWYVNKNPFDNKQTFYIYNAVKLSFVSGIRDNNYADEYCSTEISDVLLSLK